ncbi:MAG: TIGR02281 family clan AA aspartic protease [Hyphomicrobiaceae bacterium]|nr:TIGR02281 family clan AA aspartic protease [Hyphomicrobiaceae bacterium]
MDDTGQMVLMGAWLVLVLLLLPKLIMDYRGRMTDAMAHLAIWGLLFMGAITVYAYRDELKGVASRVTGEFAPYGTTETATTEGERTVRIRRSPRGSFFARTDINGAAVPMLVDTGASSIVLKSSDAEKAGIDLKALSFTIPVDTANGRTFCAAIRLDSIAVGGIKFQRVDALVAMPGNLKDSLLGMTFLSRLRSYDVSGDFMTFRS